MKKGRIYAALLRGINVGGKNTVRMPSLKATFERLGFRDVRTYINSGNVLFRAGEPDPRKLEKRIDRALLLEYGWPIKTVVRSHAEMARLVDTISKTWAPDPAWRYHVIFLRHAIDSPELVAGLDMKPEIERVVYCPGTLLWALRESAVTRTAMIRLPGKGVHQEITVRNVNTTTKILALMQEMERQ